MAQPRKPTELSIWECIVTMLHGIVMAANRHPEVSDFRTGLYDGLLAAENRRAGLSAGREKKGAKR